MSFLGVTMYFDVSKQQSFDEMAEWSKALVLGTSPKGRGFESHSCQIIFLVTAVKRERKKHIYISLSYIHVIV